VSDSKLGLERLRADILQGLVDRRSVLKRGVALGLSAPIIATLLAACGDDDDDDDADATEPAAAATDTTTGGTTDPTATSGSGQPTTAAGDPTATEGGEAAATATTGEPVGERGGGGNAKLLYWQAPVILNPHLANGTKDFHASRVCLEPLAEWAGDLSPILQLAAEWPSVEAGTLAEDLTWCVWKLREGVKWHDGEDFNAEDVVFTYEYITNVDNATTTIGRYATVESVVAEDDLTVRVTFKVPTPAWYDPFVTSEGIILPQHVYQDFQGQESRNAPANLEPIGTGPFKVAQFAPGDVVLYELFEDYWDPGKPHLDSVEIKGGGDATGAARAVMQTGEYDWAWNLQIEPQVLAEIESGGLGVVDVLPGQGTERLMINWTDPNIEVEGEKSHISTKHPLFGDVRGRQALALACDRATIAEQLYGPGGVAATNMYDEPAKFTNPNLTATFDIDAAKALLDEMGYAGGMTLLYQTSLNSVRQKTQEIIKSALEQVDIGIEIKAVDASVYFSTEQGNPDTAGKFYADLEMHTNGAGVYPSVWFERYRTDEISQMSNQWSGSNYFRYSNPEFDAMHDQFRVEVDEEKQVELAQQMLQLVTEVDYVEVPLVNRNNLAAKSNRVQGYTGSQWASNPVHDLKNWTMSDD
jgi:peptide/nickel transport system substrate-binding protein